MNELQTEIAELKQFIVELKADRTATKEKEKREAWTKYVSLSVVFIAVIAAIAAQWSGKFSGQVSMSQAQASDQWAFYQAKSIKQNLAENTLVQLEHQATNPELVAEIKKIKDNVDRYDKEKATIKSKAEDLEKKRDEAGRHGGKMSLAVSLFTVAIAAASICSVTKRKSLWYVSLAMAMLAVLQMLIAWS